MYGNGFSICQASVHSARRSGVQRDKRDGAARGVTTGHKKLCGRLERLFQNGRIVEGRCQPDASVPELREPGSRGIARIQVGRPEGLYSIAGVIRRFFGAPCDGCSTAAAIGPCAIVSRPRDSFRRGRRRDARM